jgi:hypothetical protein
VRKLVSFGLLIVFVIQIIGFVGYFEFAHYNLKKEIKTQLKQGVSKDQLALFDFNANQMKKLVWLKKNEFDLDGNLYDVVRKSNKNGITHLECISDKQEKILFAKLDQNVSSNLSDDNQQKPMSSLLKLLQTPALPFGNIIDLQMVPVSENTFSAFNYLDDLSIKSVQILSPPPQFS